MSTPDAITNSRPHTANTRAQNAANCAGYTQPTTASVASQPRRLLLHKQQHLIQQCSTCYMPAVAGQTNDTMNEPPPRARRVGTFATRAPLRSNTWQPLLTCSMQGAAEVPTALVQLHLRGSARSLVVRRALIAVVAILLRPVSCLCITPRQLRAGGCRLGALLGPAAPCWLGRRDHAAPSLAAVLVAAKQSALCCFVVVLCRLSRRLCDIRPQLHLLQQQRKQCPKKRP